MLSRFLSFSSSRVVSAGSCRLALASGVKKLPHRFNLPSPTVAVSSLSHQPHLWYCSSSTTATLRCKNNSYSDCNGALFRGKLAPIKLPFLDSVLSRCTLSSAVVAAASVSTAAASYCDCWSSGNGGAGGYGQDGAGGDGQDGESGSSSSSSGADDGSPQEQDKLTFFARANLDQRRPWGQYMYKHRKAYTPGDVSFSPFSFYTVKTVVLW